VADATWQDSFRARPREKNDKALQGKAGQVPTFSRPGGDTKAERPSEAVARPRATPYRDRPACQSLAGRRSGGSGKGAERGRTVAEPATIRSIDVQSTDPTAPR
jgi:hypothetical protein